MGHPFLVVDIGYFSDVSANLSVAAPFRVETNGGQPGRVPHVRTSVHGLGELGAALRIFLGCAGYKLVVVSLG